MKKLLIIISAALFISTIVLSFFLWKKSKNVQSENTGNFLPVSSLGENVKVKVQTFNPSAPEEKDPKNGNSGDMKLELDLAKTPFQVFWQEEYNLTSLKLIWLGFQKEISDNILVWKFSLPERPRISDPRIKIPEFGNPPLVFGQAPAAAAVAKEFDPHFFIGKMGFRYLIEATFQKQGDSSKIYKGIYAFTY